MQSVSSTSKCLPVGLTVWRIWQRYPRLYIKLFNKVILTVFPGCRNPALSNCGLVTDNSFTWNRKPDQFYYKEPNLPTATSPLETKMKVLYKEHRARTYYPSVWKSTAICAKQCERIIICSQIKHWGKVLVWEPDESGAGAVFVIPSIYVVGFPLVKALKLPHPLFPPWKKNKLATVFLTQKVEIKPFHIPPA